MAAQAQGLLPGAEGLLLASHWTTGSEGGGVGLLVLLVVPYLLMAVAAVRIYLHLSRRKGRR